MSDLDNKDAKELREILKGMGEKPSRFWSKRKLKTIILDKRDKVRKATMPEDHVDAISSMEETATADLPPKEKHKDPRLRVVHHYVTWKGTMDPFRHAALQEYPQLEFPRGVPIDLEEALRGMIGTAVPDRVSRAKEGAQKLAQWYREQAKLRGSLWVYTRKAGPVTLDRIEGSGGSGVDQLLEILKLKTPDVMTFVREIEKGDKDPVIRGPQEGTPAENRRADIILTISWLHNLEYDRAQSRGNLCDWLYDEARELQGMPRLRTDMGTESPMEV